MGYYVHLHVCFSCDENENVAALASKHLNDAMWDKCHEAYWFLDDLSKRTGTNEGPKGGLSLWGITGNYTNAGLFVEVLIPFWKELLGVDGGPFESEHIIVFYESEQSEQAECYEIGRVEDMGELIITHHDLPFAWMQM